MGTLARESIKGYTEGTTFAWQSRDLDQVSGGASAAFVHHKQNGLRSYAKLGVHRRAVIAGKQAGLCQQWHQHRHGWRQPF